jgi:hypothetical protein
MTHNIWNAERLAYEHIQAYHLNAEGEYTPLLEWSTPVEEVAQMHTRNLCDHPFNMIYN